MPSRALGDYADRPGQGFWVGSGVVLRREEGSRNAARLQLFLKRAGICWVSAPGALGSRSRFGAATEPLSWGEFRFYQSPRSTTLQDVRLFESFLSLRRSGGALREGVETCLWLSRLPCGYPDDDLLGLFWRHFRLLSLSLPPMPLRLRFLVRWLRLQGRAPDLLHCARCGKPLRAGVSLGRWGPECCGPGPTLPGRFLQDLCRAVMLAREPLVEWLRTRFPSGLEASESGWWNDAEGWLRGFFPEGAALFRKGERS